MECIERFDGDDDRSMAADNTSAFNCRRSPAAGRIPCTPGESPRHQSARDPYVKGGIVLPAAGAAYLDRDDVRPGMILDGDVVVEAFAAIGFSWGGNWTRLKDYQHFEVADPTA